MRTKPTPQQRPEAFHRVHMDFTQAVSLFIAGVLAPSVVDTLRVVPPVLQAGINAVLIRIHKCPWNDRVFEEGLARLLLHIGQHIEHHLTATLHHSKDRRPLFLHCASATLSFQSASTSLTSLGSQHSRLAFTANHTRGARPHSNE